MADGSKRRDRKRTSKRYRVRYDRILAVLLVLVVLIVIISSCAKSISGDKNKKSTTDNTGQTSTSEETPQSSIVDNLEASGETDAILSSSSGEAASQIQYTTESHSSEDVKRGDLVLINSSHEYTFPSDDTDLVTLYGNIDTESFHVSDMVIKLDSNALNALNELMKAFHAQTNNDDITIIGGYRTLEEQNDKYYNGNSTFSGGFTDYHSGRMFDMGIFPKDGSSSGYYSATGDYAWIDENAARYGFILRFPDGKETYTGEKTRTYTYRYVGVPHAYYIKQNNLCLEEYIEKIKEYNNDKPLEVNVDGTLYSVYYVASAGAATDVPIPVNKTYTVSGNNVDGFIVTVTMN